MNTILENDYAIPVSPKLATVIGLNEAIVLQQVHYWLSQYVGDTNHIFDGKCWVFNSLEKWDEQFPFWKIATTKRTFYNLIKMGLLITSRHNKKAYDRTNWYTIDYEALKNLVKSSLYQNDTMDCIKLNQCIVSKRANGLYQNDTTYTIDYTENTSKDNFIKADAKKEKDNFPWWEMQVID